MPKAGSSRKSRKKRDLIFAAYMSPGCFAEKITFFIAEYTPGSQITKGGGDDGEGEDIEILQPTLDEALKMVSSGEIVDVKTILLLHYAKNRPHAQG
jgi:GDP-mannose pyrophosphatase NudK